MIDIAKFRDKTRNKPASDVAKVGATKRWYKSWRILMDLVSPQTEERLIELKPRLDRAIRDFQFWETKLKQDLRRHGKGLSAMLFYRDEELGPAVEALIVRFRKGELTVCPRRWKEIGKKIETLVENIGHYQPK